MTINNRDVTVEQSPGILASNISTGTTGAVVWKISPAFATWMTSDENPLFKHSILTHQSVILELGSGIAGLVALATAPRVKKYVVTDQEYVMKSLRRNIKANSPIDTSKASKKSSVAHQDIMPLVLDWENSDVSDLPGLIPELCSTSTFIGGLDAVVACDCIYNEALIIPFVQTCAGLCQLRSSSPPSPMEGKEFLSPTVCIVAQQLRSNVVFEEWLRVFAQKFRVWRLTDDLLSANLKEGSGFVVHLGVLREGVSS